VYTITEYNITGNVLQTFNITVAERGPLALDLAPDDCTMYYGSWDPSLSEISRLDVCTNTPQPPFNNDSFVDDLRVLPNWQNVLMTDDGVAFLEGVPGQGSRGYYIPVPPGALNDDGLRTVSLDPDGTSFWVCCTAWSSVPVQVFRFDIASGQLLTAWAPSNFPSAVGVYGPPLVGDANVEGMVDSNTPGTAEAFAATAGYSGEMTRLHLWVDSSSTASQAVVGIYSDRFRRPGALLEQGTITDVRPGSWNYVDVPAMPVKAGHRYWIAVLAPNGGGTLSFRDASGGAPSFASAQPNLNALPAQWSGGAHQGAAGPLSAYGS
jgi:hypothetical protein